MRWAVEFDANDAPAALRGLSSAIARGDAPDDLVWRDGTETQVDLLCDEGDSLAALPVEA